MNFTVPPKMAVVDVDGAYTNIPYYLTIGSISSCFYYDDYNRLKISNLSKKMEQFWLRTNHKKDIIALNL